MGIQPNFFQILVNGPCMEECTGENIWWSADFAVWVYCLFCDIWQIPMVIEKDNGMSDVASMCGSKSE
jgi:hypothetical protein